MARPLPSPRSKPELTRSSACSAVGNGETCQDSILSFEGGSNTISIYNLNTIGANSMADRDGSSIASYTNNINAFSDTIALLRP
jgi:glucan 1,3-beta-glucosidase